PVGFEVAGRSLIDGRIVDIGPSGKLWWRGKGPLLEKQRLDRRLSRRFRVLRLDHLALPRRIPHRWCHGTVGHSALRSLEYTRHFFLDGGPPCDLVAGRPSAG